MHSSSQGIMQYCNGDNCLFDPRPYCASRCRPARPRFDGRKIGHFGTGDLEVTIPSDADLERAKPLLDRACHES